MFEIKMVSAIQEIKIGGEVFKVDMSDKNLNDIFICRCELPEKIKNVKTLDDLLVITKEFVNVVFVDSPFEAFYQLHNGSTHALIGTLQQVPSVLEELKQKMATVSR